MIKKTIVGLAVALMVGLFCFGRDLVSYVRTSTGYLKEAVNDAVPTEFQIQRARGMIKDLIPEIRKNMHIIAKEEAEVERLGQQIADAQANLAKDKDEMLRLKADLTSGKDTFQYGGRTYTASQVRTNLANRFERYKTAEATLASLREIQKARQKSLDAAREKLDAMMAAKRQLAVEVENLEARLQMVAASQAAVNYNFDDSKLGRVKELVADLKTRLDVAERLVNAEGTYQDDIPLDKPAPENIVQQVTEYFAHSASAKSDALAKQ